MEKWNNVFSTSPWFLLQGIDAFFQFVGGNRLGNDLVVVVKQEDGRGSEKVEIVSRLAVECPFDVCICPGERVFFGIFFPVFPFFVDGNAYDFDIVFPEKSVLDKFGHFVHEYLAMAASRMPENQQGVRVYFAVQAHRVVVEVHCQDIRHFLADSHFFVAF